jgi:hypothetical protein
VRKVRATGVLFALVVCVSAIAASSAGAAGGKSMKCDSFKAPVVNGFYNTYTDITVKHTSCKTARKVLVAWEHWTPKHTLELGFACYASPLAGQPSSCTLRSAVITFKYKEHAAKS